MPDSSSNKKEDLLVRLAKQGSADAFEALWQIHGTQICTYLANLIGNKETALDLAQETFLNAWKNLPSLREDRYFKTWLYRIATNTIPKYLLLAKSDCWLSLEEHELLTPIEDNREIALEDLVIERVMMQRALEHVKPLLRQCVLLQIVGGFRQREIAEILGIKEVKHVSTYVKRGLVQLSKAYALVEQEQDIPETRRSV